MISNDTILALATKYQTTELNIRREYVQHLFLSYFSQHPQSEQVYFKGGTALRIAYNSPRFSEDLDFSATGYTIRPLEESVIDTLRDIERENVPTEIIESKQTTGGYLAVLLFRPGAETVQLQLEVSLRQGDKRGDVVTIASDFIPSYVITILERQQLVGEKLQALLTRQKPRDFYDLYFLLRARVLTQEERGMLRQVLTILRASPLSFEHELKQFLPRTHWPMIRDFKPALEREIEQFL